MSKKKENPNIKEVPAKRTARKLSEQPPKKKIIKKIKYKVIFLFLILILLITLIIKFLLNIPITNIIIENNHFYTDQEIIDMANISNYPSALKTFSFKIEDNLRKNMYISDAKVKKKYLTRIYISVSENTPLFFLEKTKKTVLKDGTLSSDKFIIPCVINEIPDDIYDKFLKNYNKINENVIDKISEIKYDPVKDIDNERFFLIMSDGNYVYLTLNNFTIINRYVSILKKINNQKGTLYLDDGEYFEPRK